MASQELFWVRWSQRIVDKEWLILALLLPFALFPSPFRFTLLLTIPALWLLRKHAYGHFVDPTPFDPAILALLIMLLVSLFVTFDVHFSLAKIAGLLYGIAVFYAAAAATRQSWQSMAAGIGILITSGLIITILTLAGANWSPKFPVLREITALLPRFIFFSSAAPEGVSPNQAAGALLWVLPPFIMVIVIGYKEFDQWQQRLGGRWATAILVLALVALALMAGVFLLTQSRSAFAGLAVALLFLLLVYRGYRWHVMLAMLLVFAALFTGVMWQLEGNESVVESVPSGEEELGGSRTITAQYSLAQRQEIWGRALYGIQDYPLTGMGMGAFRRMAPALYPLFLTPYGKDIAHAHNHLLQTALDLGLPGLAAYLALWILAGVLLWQVWRAAAFGRAGLLAIGFAGGLLGYFVYGLTDTVALGAKPGFIFWLLLGLIVGLHRLVGAWEWSAPR